MFQEVNLYLFLGKKKKKDSQEEVAFKGALFHSREHLSSATTEVEIGSNLKGLSDTDKYKKYVLMKKRRAEIANAAGSNPI